MRRHHIWVIVVAVVVALIVWLGRQRKAGEPPADQPPTKAPEAKGGLGESMKARYKRATLVQKIHEAQRRREVPATDSLLDADYIRGRIDDLKPLVKECYDLALREHPNLEGKLVLRFDIVGEPLLGGVVESLSFVRQNDAGTLDTNLEECVRATVETQTFAAPDKGGRTTVTFPFVFAK